MLEYPYASGCSGGIRSWYSLTSSETRFQTNSGIWRNSGVIAATNAPASYIRAYAIGSI